MHFEESALSIDDQTVDFRANVYIFLLFYCGSNGKKEKRRDSSRVLNITADIVLWIFYIFPCAETYEIYLKYYTYLIYIKYISCFEYLIYFCVPISCIFEFAVRMFKAEMFETPKATSWIFRDEGQQSLRDFALRAAWNRSNTKLCNFNQLKLERSKIPD